MLVVCGPCWGVEYWDLFSASILQWNCALFFPQISIRNDRKHASAVWKRLEGVVSLFTQPEYTSARPLWCSSAGWSVFLPPLFIFEERKMFSMFCSCSVSLNIVCEIFWVYIQLFNCKCRFMLHLEDSPLRKEKLSTITIFPFAVLLC